MQLTMRAPVFRSISLSFKWLAVTLAACAANAQPLHKPLIEVVAFGVAPVAGVDADARLRAGPEDIIHRLLSRPAAQAAQQEAETRVLAGERWPGLLRRLGEKLDSELMGGDAVAARVEKLVPAPAAGKYVRARLIPENSAAQVDYIVETDEVYTILLSSAGVQTRRHAGDPRLVERMRGDASKASLFTATDAIGLPEEIVLQLAEIFSDQVDFHQELHHGYRCTLVYEVHYRDGHIDRAGRILAAEFVIRNRRLQAYYYSDGLGRSGYFDETGRSLHRTFRKTPVEFTRITSGYTLARFHPILGLWRAHRGIDYAAPLGTRVVATAAGTVEFMGDRGELGNTVILRHFGKFLSYYGHLNDFAQGLAVGAKVDKGQVIGYVGMTGLATGPHLHFEFHVEDGSGKSFSMPSPPDVLEDPPVESPAFFDAVRAFRSQMLVAQQAHVVVLE
jgi:murein DD-endopeptidase MepM/ murein hydrolase activator NlpD